MKRNGRKREQARSRAKGGRSRMSAGRRRRLLLVFALIFGAVGGRGVVHAREVPFSSQPAITTTADGARSVYAADVDGDGDLDVLSASNNDDKVAWHENLGGGTWALHTISTTANSAFAVHAADVDGDGDLDVLSASNEDNKLAWYENTGGGTSWVLHTISTAGNGIRSVYAADVDGDGDLDVLGAGGGFSGKVAWFENVGGAGTSWTQHTITTNLFVSAAYAADVDGDGDLDVISSSTGATVRLAWHENVGGGGTSWTLHTISTTADGYSVYAADIDGDGDLDVLSATFADDRLAWHENVGGGGTAWTAHTITTTADFAISVYAADLDADGDLDVVGASRNDDEVAWYENAGNGTTWTKHTLSTTADGAFAVFAADVDGDGDLDALSASSDDDTIAWFRNDTIHRSATFVAMAAISTTASSAYAVHAADVDGDGDLDALSASRSDNKIAWYENVGGEGTSWALHTISTTATGARAVYAADVDGDGDMDVLSASRNDNKIAWYENVGGGGTSWALHTISTTASAAYAVYAADVDGDGDLDALSASRNNNRIAWHENVGGGGTSWTLHTVSTTASVAHSVFAADVDRDGDLDVLSASGFDDKIAWYENVGGAGTSWNLHTIATTANDAHEVYAADVDGDGDIDALSASFLDGEIAWYENDGGGGTSWALHTISTNATYSFSMYAVDLDGDGDLDVASAANGGNQLAWYENVDGGGSSWSPHPIPPNGSDPSAVYAADVDGDGDLDLLSASNVADNVAWYENASGQFALATVDTAPASIFASAADDVLRITMTHRGRDYGGGLDHDAELATLDFGFDDGSAAPMSTPLSSGEANALVDELRVYHDDGNSVFDGGDTLVTTVETLALTAGRQTVTLTDGDPDVLVGPEASETFFVVLAATADADTQTPDALRVTHVTSSSSTAEDRDHDIPLTLEEVADETSDLVTFEAAANLSVTKSDGVTMVDPGDPLTYTIVASNAGPSNAPGSTVTDTFPATLTGCTWTCIGSSGGTCTAGGSGDIADTVHLPAGGNVIYTVDCTVAENATNLVVNTATVDAPGGLTDPEPGNNSATDVDTLQEIFADGFETGDTSRWDDEEPES